MHTAGKVLVWVIVVLSLAAIYFSARALKTQREWQTKADALSEKSERNAESLSTKRHELANLQSELGRVMMPWERYWNGVAIELVDPKTGDIRAAIGTDQALGAPFGENRPRPVIHAFRPLGDGKFVYVGPFQVIDIREAASVLRPAWRLRASDAEHFQKRNDKWRFRALIPTAQEQRFRTLEAELTTAEEALVARMQHVKEQSDLIKLAQEHYDLRLRELLGAQEGAKTPDVDEYVIGLQGAIGREEESRNAELSEITRLRGALRDQYAMAQQLSKQNSDLAKRLPQPSSSTISPQVTSR